MASKTNYSALINEKKSNTKQSYTLCKHDHKKTIRKIKTLGPNMITPQHKKLVLTGNRMEARARETENDIHRWTENIVSGRRKKLRDDTHSWRHRSLGVRTCFIVVTDPQIWLTKKERWPERLFGEESIWSLFNHDGLYLLLEFHVETQLMPKVWIRATDTAWISFPETQFFGYLSALYFKVFSYKISLSPVRYGL